MIKIENENKSKLSSEQRKNITFSVINYKKFSQDVKGTFDAIVCMGNSLPYIPVDINNLAVDLYKKTEKNGIFVAQILNFSRILKDRLLSFNIKKNVSPEIKETLYIEFINELGSKWVDHNVAVFNYDGINWLFNGITSIKVQHLTMKDMYHALSKAGFREIRFSGNIGEYQGEYGKLDFDMPYDDKFHDWLNVVAIK
jgi:hypothetical protein